MTSLGRRHLGPEVPEQGSVLLTGPGLTSTVRARWEDQSSVCGVGVSQRRRAAVIRKASAEKHDYHPAENDCRFLGCGPCLRMNGNLNKRNFMRMYFFDLN